MSEPIPESIPTSADPRSKRPLKRRALTPVSEQAAQIDSLFKDPTKDIRLPATSKPRTASSLPPPPEIVANVQGSSAGAGSGEFHVYKASRRREYERIRLMEEELKREKANEDFGRKMADAKRKDEEKTEKNRRKREKKKTAKNKKSCGNDGGDDEMIVDKPKMAAKEGPSSALPEGSDEQSTSNNPEETSHEVGVIIYED
jgi:PRKR-interacting protein 1